MADTVTNSAASEAVPSGVQYWQHLMFFTKIVCFVPKVFPHFLPDIHG
jgi:hypothetical protein